MVILRRHKSQSVIKMSIFMSNSEQYGFIKASSLPLSSGLLQKEKPVVREGGVVSSLNIYPVCAMTFSPYTYD